jgi:hypothetical protein
MFESDQVTGYPEDISRVYPVSADESWDTDLS